MNKKRILYFILTLIMAIVIFLFSSQKSEDSNNLSYRIDIKIFNLINKKTESTSADEVSIESKSEIGNTVDEEDVKEYSSSKDSNSSLNTGKNFKFPVTNKLFHDIDTVVRKTAHVTLYALFAISLTLFVKTYKIKNWKVVLIVIVVGFLYACLDEFNQKVRGTRSGIFSDCLIDTAGSLIGVCVASVGEWIGKKRKENKGIE